MEFDDFSPEDELKYLGYSSFPVEQTDSFKQPDAISAFESRKRPPTKNRFLNDDDNDVDDEYGELEEDIQAYQFSGKSKDINVDDKEMDDDPIMKTMEFLVPIRRMASSRRVVPFYIQTSAETLLIAASNDGGSVIALDAPTREALRGLTGHMDEFAQVDPLVTIYTSLEVSDTFKAYLEETIPFSEYILLRVLHARFNVNITNKVKTKPIPFDDPELQLHVIPYNGEGGGPLSENKGQLFHVQECLREAGERLDSDKWTQIRAHMLSLGKMSPKDVCDREFIEDQVEVFKDIISGKTRIVQKKRQKKESFNE